MPILSTIRVLLVDDSPLVLAGLKRLLAQSPEILIVGTAKHGKEALEMLDRVKPDIICTDLYMPEMNGLELVRAVMARSPMPILVISASVVEGEDSGNIFRLLEAGALDVFPKPRHDLASDAAFAHELSRKIKVLAGVHVFPRKSYKLPAANLEPKTIERRPISAVAIGASTGGPQALQEILTALPSGFPAPVFCVQHISTGFMESLRDWLDGLCHLKVQFAQPGERPSPGTIYFPNDRTHLELSQNGLFLASTKPPLDGHCPSATVMFDSVAQLYGNKAIGVLLTGMGRDGASGLLSMARAGGITIAQDEASSVVFGMPRAAIELGAAQYILSLGAIAPMLCGLTIGTKRD
jgi:two-component system, chemotaxis family, protein-glutamate methylesterase/glutaminase